MIKINFVNDTKFNLDEGAIREIVKTTLSKLEVKNDIILEIILTSDSEIQKLNNLHRKIDKPTDVLSFPQSQIKSSKLNILGSIIICPKIASERNESTEDLVKHGLLHLTGYDHETDQKKWDQVSKIVNHNL